MTTIGNVKADGFDYVDGIDLLENEVIKYKVPSLGICLLEMTTIGN